MKLLLFAVFIDFTSYWLFSWMFSFFEFLSGTGLAAVFINISVENFAGWKFALTFSIIQKSYVAGFLLYILINLALVYSSVYIITQFAPAAAGSGIPEIKGYLNGMFYSFFFCFLLIWSLLIAPWQLRVLIVIQTYRNWRTWYPST